MKEQILFPIVRYGHRTRYDIILSRNDLSKGRESLFLRLAKHAIKEGRTAGVLNDVTGVRFVAVSWPMGSAELTEAKGAWKDTRVSALPAKWQRVVAEFEIQGSSVKAVKPTQVSGRRTLKPSLPATKSMAPSTAVSGPPVKETSQPAALIPPPTPPPSRALMPNLPPAVDVPKSKP